MRFILDRDKSFAASASADLPVLGYHAHPSAPFNNMAPMAYRKVQLRGAIVNGTKYC